MRLFSLLYFSRSCMDLAHGELLEQLNTLLSVAQRNNEINGLTGVLMFDSDWFVQCLEGEQDQIWSSFKKIEADLRHSQVTVVEMVRTHDRSFGKWRMKCAEKNRHNATLFEPYLSGDRFRPDLLTRVELRALLSTLHGLGSTAYVASAPDSH